MSDGKADPSGVADSRVADRSAAARRGAARIGWLIALAVLIADQVSKLVLLHGFDLETAGGFRVAPFLDIVLVWNRGISYGLLQQEPGLGRWLLVVVSVAAVIGLGWWLARGVNRFTALALGLIIGGAVGNGIDRVAYGAVVDFVHFHVGDFSWYVFNIADVAIVAGAVGLVIDSLAGAPRRRETRPPSGEDGGPASH